MKGNLIDTIIIRCNVLSPAACLDICLKDANNGLLGDQDNATVPICCHSDASDDVPAVCYTLEINCRDTQKSPPTIRR